MNGQVLVFSLLDSQRFSTQITPRPVFSTTYNFIVFFLNHIEGRDPFKIFHDHLLPGHDPAVEKPVLEDPLAALCPSFKFTNVFLQL
jgi:hypothetical protein